MSAHFPSKNTNILTWRKPCDPVGAIYRSERRENNGLPSSRSVGGEGEGGLNTGKEDELGEFLTTSFFSSIEKCQSPF